MRETQPSAAAIGALLATLACCATLAACDQLARFKTHDRYGPIPRFSWIDQGQPRPTPHIADTEVGPELRPEAEALADRFALDCPQGRDETACLRRNWLLQLQSVGETELSSPPNSRSYRILEFGACSPPISVRLDIHQDGSGVLVTSRAADRRRGSAAWRSSALVPASTTAPVEQAVARSAFERMTADPSALWERSGCYDGVNWVFEAYINGHYRYVARHSCYPDAAKVRDLGQLLIHLAQVGTPGLREGPGC